ncbi:MFS transporter [Ferrovibrio terrae]|uniref:MFS transporter n=2 Tax=Ferrovibrio terrae TaxID=2594003 RepID=A0A516H7B7_9PROT|nr:MFS transporter [Ferrovibrio terrae]
MDSPAVKAGRREWVGLAVLALPCLLYSMDLTVLNLAVPQLSADLQPSSIQLLWIVDIYGFMVAGSLITMGTLGDRIGRRRVLLIGAVAFGITSVFAAFVTTADMLILARALLGIAAATLAPSTLSLIRNMFHNPQQRTVAIGIWVASFSAGGAIGPVIGGALLEYFWWGSVFLVALPVMALLLVLGPILLPEYKDPKAGRLDILSAVLSLVAVLPVIYGIKRLAEYGLNWPSGSLILFGVVMGAIFVRRQLRLADPMIDMTLFRSASFSTALAINIIGVFIAFGMFLFLAQYFQLVLGMGALEAGLWMAPMGVTFIIGSMLAPMVIRRLRPGTVLALGLALAAVGYVMIARAGGPQGFIFLMAGSIVFCLGLSPVFTLTTDLVVSTAPPERAGAAAAMSETSAEFGGALGIAVLGSLAAAAYRSTIGQVLPPGLSPAAEHAARSTLGGAVTVAADLPAASGAALLEAARLAFSQGFFLSVLACAVIAALGAVMAAVMLRRVPTGGASH